jgi:8-oxo-dGTP diphosphatase
METFRFCPSCGGPLASRSLKTGEPDRLVCGRCDYVFYLDPKVAVGTIVDDGQGRVLLIRRAIEPGYGRWVFPGGYVDRGEPVEAAALREALEESGLVVRLLGLVDVYSYQGRVPIILVYAASYVSGEIRLDEEGLEARWFPSSEVPWDELAFRSTSEGLRDYLTGRLHRLKIAD